MIPKSIRVLISHAIAVSVLSYAGALQNRMCEQAKAVRVSRGLSHGTHGAENDGRTKARSGISEGTILDVLPELNTKIRELFGFDFSDLLARFKESKGARRQTA